MENNNQNQTQPEPPKEPENKPSKQQRKLKFKTLDGKITSLECDYDIKILDLKKKLEEIFKIEPNRQRLLNKGKQFKDDETLDKLVEKDDTIIHLVFRSESDVKSLQENTTQNTQNNNTQNNNNSNNQNQNANPFQNIFNMIYNSDEIRNITTTVVSQILGQNQNPANPNQNNAQNTNNNNPTNPPINIGNTQYHSLNLTESLNLVNSPLHPASQSPNLTNPPPLNLNNPVPGTNPQSQGNSTQNQNSNNPPLNPNNYSCQFPISTSERDKKYDAHLKKIDEELNLTDELMSNKIEPRIPLPLINTTQNVFTAISRQLRKYVIVNQNMLCHLMRLADLMEREQFITDSEARMTGNKLLDQAYKALAHTSKASQYLSNVIKSSNFNTQPNTGYIGVVCQEIGLQSTSIPINVSDLNLNNANLNLENLMNSGNNGGNNNNALNNLGNIVISAINNNINQQGQNSGEINAAIPINVVVNAGTSPINNTNQNQNISTQNQQTVQNIDNNNQTTPENKTNQEKKEEKNENEKKPENKENEENKEQKEQKENKEQKEQKPEEKKPEVNQNTNNNPTNTQNQNQHQNQNTDFGNIFGTVMNQMMRPENLNSIAGAMGSLLGNNNSNSNNNQGNTNPMNMFGNLFQNIMGSFGDESDEDEPNPPQQNQQPQNTQNIQAPQVQNTPASKGDSIQKLVFSPQLRRETKLNDEEKLGEKIEPNIEFNSVSNEIVSNLTVQDVFDMFNLRFKGLSRLRKDIQKKFFSEKEKSEEILNKVVEILCERFILMENQIDKLNPNKEFIMDEFFNKHLKEIFNMFISDELINKKDEEWEVQMRQLVIKMFKELINELKDIYESGEDGAKTFIEFNMTTLIENLVGPKLLEKIQKYDEDIMNKFVENIFIIIKTEQIKEDSKEKENSEKPTLLTIDEIFKIAMKDKERLEKEEKEEKEEEKGQEEKDKKKYSDFYYMTSLFKK